MKKNFTKLTIVLVGIALTMSSCGTVFGGRVSECQRTKPVAGTPSRKIRPAAMICDIVLFPLGLVVDFATGAMYKPCSPDKSATTMPAANN